MDKELKHFISLEDFSEDELWKMLELTMKLKNMHKKNRHFTPLKGRILGMLFKKASTRTRISFEVAMYQLGGIAIFLSASDLQLGRGETIKDTALVVSRYLNAIMIRTGPHNEVTEFAKYAAIPVINGLTDLHHPCQVLSDIFTIWEKKKTLKNIKLTYIGDGNNMANSWAIGASKMGINITFCCPLKYYPDKETIEKAKQLASARKSVVEFVENPADAVKDADIVYTDAWYSMGFESEKEERKKIFKPYQINKELLQSAKPDHLVMHCLPAHRGEELTDNVLDGPHSIVIDEAENRLHSQKALLVSIMK